MVQRSPQTVLRRVLRLSGVNGWSIALFAGVCALISLLFGQLVGAGVGIMVALGGVVELRGRRRLRQRDPDGMHLLVRAQLIVLGVIWVYAISRLASFDAEFALSNQTPEMQQLLTEAGVDAGDLLGLIRIVFYGMYTAVMAASLLYQGGLAWFYHRCAASVKTALLAPPTLPPTPSF